MNAGSSRPNDRRFQIDRLRGMFDVEPDDFERRATVLDRLLDRFAVHGYRQVDTPVVEPTELFLRKSGGERVAQMYAFHYRDREIALRPEHTASILRMYTTSLQSEPLPIRLSYAGPVFRYEKPQAGRTRQFTEVGCELLGGAGPTADAEIIHLALEGLADVGVAGRLVLGHVGIVLDYLDRLPLRQRARDWLLWSMERLRKGQEIDLDSELSGLVSTDRLSDLFDEMSASFRDVPMDQLEQWVLAVLREVGVQTHGGNRSPEEIVAGVIAKMNRHSDADDVRHAFGFLRELADLQGPPGTVLPELRELVRRHRLSEEPIARLEQVLELLAAYGHRVDDIELHLGLGRGLHYYTGVLFEIYDGSGSDVQLCGGGRYDDLAQVLGSRQALPACGFSYGLERVIEASEPVAPVGRVEVLVVAADSAAMPAAIRVAESLRASGRMVVLDVRSRSVGANRRFAQRVGIDELVVVRATGETEHQFVRANGGAPVVEPSNVGGEVHG